jgi:hypothetical protein
VTELSRREIRVIGNFALEPNLANDGTLIMGARTFLKLFAASPLRVDFDVGEIACCLSAFLSGRLLSPLQCACFPAPWL